jgi:hypothetical protein
MKEGHDINQFVEDLAKVEDEVKEVVEEVTKVATREVEQVVVEEVLSWFQKLKSMWPKWCYRPHQIENPSLAKPEETESKHTD